MRDSGNYPSHHAQPIFSPQICFETRAALGHVVNCLRDRTQFVVLVGESIVCVRSQVSETGLNLR